MHALPLPLPLPLPLRDRRARLDGGASGTWAQWRQSARFTPRIALKGPHLLPAEQQHQSARSRLPTAAGLTPTQACSMAWQLGEFARERVERGRRLLAESEEHRGSPDLQVGRRQRAAGASAGSGVAVGWPRQAVQLPPPAIDCLQAFVEDMTFTVAMNRLFLDDSGRQRTGLTAQEKQQGLVLHLLSASCSSPLLLTALARSATWPLLMR